MRLSVIGKIGRLLLLCRVEIPVKDPQMAGKRLLFISDWHWHGSERNFQQLADCIAVIKKFVPDVVMLGGDISEDADQLTALPELLSGLTEACGKIPVIAVNGNWEIGKRWLQDGYFAGLYARYGITLLENSGITLSGINFTGLPDISSIDYRRLPEDTAKPGAVNILLTHSPDGVIAADKGKFLCNFTAAFCGHTHGGQIRLPLIGSLYCPSFYRCKFDRGVFGRRGSDFKVIISSGIGEHRKGFRLFCPPEVVIAELVCR